MKKITPKIIVNGERLSSQTLIDNRQNLALYEAFLSNDLIIWSSGQNDIKLSSDMLNSYLGGKKLIKVYYSFLQQATDTTIEFQDRDKIDFEDLQTRITNSSGMDLDNLYNLLTKFLQYQVYLYYDIEEFIDPLSINKDEIMILSRIILELTDSPLYELKDYLEESIKKMSYPKISRLKIKSAIFDMSRQTIKLEKDEVIIKISHDSPINIIGTEEEKKGNKNFRSLSDFLFELDKPLKFNIKSYEKIEIFIAEVSNIREYVYRRDNRLHHY